MPCRHCEKNKDKNMELTPELRKTLLAYQKNEITEHHIDHRLAQATRSVENSTVLESISQDELRHYKDWKSYTGEEVKPDRFAIWKYTWLGRILGLTFSIKLMEKGEEKAQATYTDIEDIPEIYKWIDDEDKHEHALIEMLDEDLLHYAGSVVLGLNDALVELTGALAGLTLALQNTKLIALTGLITGIAAAMSMGLSEYLLPAPKKPASSLCVQPFTPASPISSPWRC